MVGILSHEEIKLENNINSASGISYSKEFYKNKWQRADKKVK